MFSLQEERKTWNSMLLSRERKRWERKKKNK